MSINRRRFISAAGLAAGSLAVVAPGNAAESAPGAAARSFDAGPGDLTAQLVKFTRELRFEDLSPKVVHECRRYLLDSLGCAVAGHLTDKGRIATAAIGAMGGHRQATLLGTRQQVSTASAAFINGELLNALDYDTIPHIPPFVIPPILALAEQRRASGSELMLATVIAHEISARLSSSSSQMGSALLETGSTPEVFGINTESVLAAAAGSARLLGLDAAGVANALGLAGYYCPPQAAHDWETGSPKTMVKYTPAGWICQGAVTAAVLAEAGFTGNPIVLDGPAGFPRFYGWRNFRPEAVTAKLGEEFRIVNVDFKPHACCRFIHSQLDCMLALVQEHRLTPDNVLSVHSLGVPFVANPDQMNVRTQGDAQFSIPYMLALAIHDIPVDARCQSHERLGDPAIRRTMAKITWGTHPDSSAAKRKDPATYIARVEAVTASGRYVHESLYATGTARAGMALSDDHLDRKFIANASTRLSAGAARKAADLLWKLDAQSDVSKVVRALGV